MPVLLVLLAALAVMASSWALPGAPGAGPPGVRPAAGRDRNLARVLGPRVRVASIGLAALGAWLLLSPAPAAWQLAGPAGLPLVLAPDPLSGWFLLAAGTVAAARPAGPDRGDAGAGRLLGASLAACAGDWVLLLAGLALALRPGPAARPASVRVAAGGALLAAAALAVADRGGTLLSGSGGPVLFCALAALTLAAWPARGERPDDAADADSPARPTAILLALFLTARLMSGTGVPPGGGAALLLLGAGGALAGALRANRAADRRGVADAALLAQGGVALAGLGLALLLRAADLGPLAAAAAGGALVHALVASLGAALLRLTADEARARTGTDALGAPAGLIHALPGPAFCALVAAGSMAALPPLAGFASAWTVLQSLFAAWRVGEIGAQLALLASLGLLGPALPLLLTAMLRLWGLTFAGPPRHGIGGGAGRPGLPGGAARGAAVVLAAALLLAGLLPGLLPELVLPAARALVGLPAEPAADPVAGWWRVGQDGARLLPLPALVLLVAGTAALVGLARRLGPGGASPEARRAPAWTGGAAPDPDRDPPPLSPDALVPDLARPRGPVLVAERARIAAAATALQRAWALAAGPGATGSEAGRGLRSPRAGLGGVLLLLAALVLAGALLSRGGMG